MPFDVEPTPPSGTIEASRTKDGVTLVVSEKIYQLPLSTARTICDLLAITVYDESIVALIAKRRRLSFENDELKDKLQNMYQYQRRKHRKEHSWKKSH